MLASLVEVMGQALWASKNTNQRKRRQHLDKMEGKILWMWISNTQKKAIPASHRCSKFDRYGVWFGCRLAAHAKAQFGDFARCRRVFWRLVLLFSREVLGCTFVSGPIASHSTTRDRLSFHSVSLLLRPCLRRDNSTGWTNVIWDFKIIHLCLPLWRLWKHKATEKNN